jgi:glycosyltransferase involved in cell wall biosynthesis
LGPKFGDAKCQIYKSSDIFCFPTYYPNETFGIVNIEAMEAGLPIITTPEGGISDIIEEGINGYLIPQKDSASLAEKIALLIENPSLRRKMGINAREKYLKYYTVEHFERRLTEIINKTHEPTNPAT